MSSDDWELILLAATISFAISVLVWFTLTMIFEWVDASLARKWSSERDLKNEMPEWDLQSEIWKSHSAMGERVHKLDMRMIDMRSDVWQEMHKLSREQRKEMLKQRDEWLEDKRAITARVQKLEIGAVA